MTTIELVRHAEARSRDEWVGKPDRDRPLSDLGQAQSKAIAATLGATRIVALYSSPFLRCVQTLEPLGGSLGLPVSHDDALGEDRSLDRSALGARAIVFVDRVVRQHAGRRLVACSHGDVIPALMAVLAGRDGFELADVELDKGAWLSLRFDGHRCVAVTHVPVPET
jgi:broad specificity phosphatase PhoE